MGDISHTHPYADEGAMTRVFDRGPVIADGGKVAGSGDPREAAEGDEDAEANENAEVDEDTEAGSETMADIEHTPPEGAGDVDGVFDRGPEEQEPDA